MKTYTFLAVILGLITIFSCKTAEQESVVSEDIPAEGTVIDERPLDTRDPNRTSFSAKQKQQILHQKQTQEHPSRPQFMYQYNQNMYSELNMTDDQIRQFEDRDREYMNSTTNAQHANRDEMLRQRNENLRGILNQAQYKKYQQWVINNPPGF